MPTFAPERQIHTSLHVGRPDGVTWTDVSPYLSSVSVELGDISGIGTGQSGVDGVVRRATFRLRNDRCGIPGDSFSPRDRESAWNQWQGQYVPLLWPNREVWLRVAATGEPGPGQTSVVGERATPVPVYHDVVGETLTLSHTVPWQYPVTSASPSQVGTETIYYWQDSIGRDETYVVGDESLVVGDEADSATLFVQLLFGVAPSTRQVPVYQTAHTPLVPHTVTVRINGIVTPHVDINYATGEIVVYDESWTPGSTVTVDYTYVGTARVYHLAHGDVVPGSETVRYNGTPTMTYGMDYAAGTLTLYEVGTGGTVTVDYFYTTYDYQRYDVAHVDLLDGTVTVYVNGFETSDYIVDYGLGRITFTSPLSPTDVVTADYAYWVTLFHGLLGDSIRTDGPVVECELRDLAKRLQTAYIRPEKVRPYDPGTPIAAETLIQNLLDDILGVGEVTLYFPNGTAQNPRPVSESPLWMTYPRPEIWEYKSCWDAIQSIVAQFGWFVGYRWHRNTGRMQLILMEPPRSKNAAMADFHLSWEDDIYAQDLTIADPDIRNVIIVTYRDAATGERKSVNVQDDNSIAAFGEIAMEIEEGDASLIDTEGEALRLAQAALADLKDLTATTHLNLPLLPTLDVFAGIVVTDPRVSSTDDFYGVESVRHTIDFEARQFRTEAVCAGRVVGGHHRWLKMQTRPGAKSILTPGDWATHARPPAPVVTLSTGLDQVAQSTTAYVKASWQRPDWRYIDRYAVRIRRIGSDTYQYQETRELSATFHGLVANVEYAVQVAVIDGRGVIGEPSQEVTITTPKDTTIPATPTGLTVASHLRGVEASINPNTEPDLRHYVWEKNVDGAGWEVFARDLVTDRVIPAASGKTVQVRVRAEDWSGNVSNPTQAKSATAGRVGVNDLEDGSATTRKIEQGAVTGLEVIQVDDTTGFSTTDPINWKDIPGFSITIQLNEAAAVLVLMRISAYVLAPPGYSAKGFFRLVYNGTPVRAQAIEAVGGLPAQDSVAWSSAVVLESDVLGAGVHVFSAQIKADTDFPNSTVIAFTRELIGFIFKR